MAFAVLFLGLIVIFSYGMGNVSAASNVSGSNIYIDTHGNDSWNGLSATHSGLTGPKLTIQNATQTVNKGGTINIANGYYSKSKDNNITIDKNMNIRGQSETGTIITGSNTNWIFYILPGVNVTISNLSLINGTKSVKQNKNFGGAIYNAGILNIYDSTFNGNTVNGASNYGGAIYNVGKLAITNSDFTYNSAISNTDTGGGAICNSGNMTIKNSSFTKNFATGLVMTLGGAIYNDGGTSSNLVTITGCNFTDNTANPERPKGGAIYNSGFMSVVSSSFTGNTAFIGGAIDNDYGTMIVFACKFTNNVAKTNGSTGGAINNYGTLTATSNTFKNNTADDGGAIYTNNTSHMHFNQFVGNKAGDGSAIESGGGIADATLNWWGTNAGPTTNIFGNVTVSPWLVLKVTAKPNIPNNSQTTITANLLYDNNGVYHNPLNGHVLNGIPVTYTTTLGTITSPANTVNGNAVSTFKNVSKTGNSTVYTKLDNQTIKTLITITDPVTLKVTSTTPSNNAQNVSLTSPITIKFSENITPGVNYSKIYIKNLNTGKFVVITKIISGNTLTIKQTTCRLKNDTYQIYIPTGALKDKTGHNSETYTFKFKSVQ